MTRRPARGFLAGAFLVLLVCCGAGSPALAGEPEVSFDIPAQPLASALLQFSDQAGAQIASNSVDVSNSYSHGVQGQMPVEAALKRLLEGTGFSFVALPENTFAVRRGSGRAAGSDPPPSATHAFDIPGGPLSDSLDRFAAQSGLRVEYDHELVRGHSARPYQNTAPSLVVLEDLLAGSGLTYRVSAPGTVIIARPETTAAAPTSAALPAPGAQGTQLATITVTGSRIKRPGYDTLEATSVIDSAQIENRGYTNALQALQATPGFGAPSSSPISAAQGRMNIGQSFANFFGLGSQRTLTLVNGQRFVSSNPVGTNSANASPGSQVDLNLIPIDLIDRIETVAIGGAPVYGSDAIAGTVNIILKDNFEGVAATAQYGISEKGDAQNKMASVLMGGNFASNRGNAVISAEYVHQDPLVFSDRYGLSYALPNPAYTGPGEGIPAVLFYPDVHFDFMTEGGMPYDGSLLDIPGLHYPGLYPNGNYIFDSSGQPMRFAPDGELVPLDFGTVVNSASLGGGISVPLYSTGGDGVNAADHFGLLAGSTRKIFNGIAHFDLTDNVRAFINTEYAHTSSVLPSDVTSLIAPGLFPSPSLTFSVDNPFLSDQARDIIEANGLTSFNLARNLNDLVDRNPATLDLNVSRVVLGLKGNFDAFGNQWSWDVSYNNGTSRSVSTDTYINPDRLVLAADAVRDASGEIVCASGGDCVPIDLFGENAFSSAAAAYVSDRVATTARNSMNDWQANISGGLPFEIAREEPVKISFGFEHRAESGSTQPDAGAKLGDTLVGVPGFTAISGSYSINAFYGETLIPLVSDAQRVSWVKAASVDLAARHVDNSINGGALTWSAGGRFQPRFPGLGDGLVFRGVFMHAIRSPSITELFLPSSGSLGGIVDPCDAGNYTSGPNPAARTANCEAALAAAGAPQPGEFHSTTRSISVAGLRTGNPNLKNETADSWSVGMVYQPVEFPRFRMSLDWNHIKLKDGIVSLGIDDILASCYDSSNYPDNDACALFSRLTAAEASTPRVPGDVAPGYKQGFVNSSGADLSGAILAAEYVQPLPHDAGALNFSGSVFYRNHYNVVDFEGGSETHAAGTIAYPKVQATLSAGYSWRRFETVWQARWTSGVVIDNTATIEDYPAYFISPYTLVSATFGYKFTPGVSLRLIVNNVFDKKLPDVALEQRAFSLYDPIG
ncbi:MAG TPA: TonB-dependent receptor, partial [Rhodanobacteraceae bacterium]|nr:TonB-dependent receptor [Rhodanobacteraceae bacterium]